MTVHAVQALVCFPDTGTRDSVLAAAQGRMGRALRWGPVTLAAATHETDGHPTVALDARFLTTLDADDVAARLRRVKGSLHGTVRVHACSHDQAVPASCTASDASW